MTETVKVPEVFDNWLKNYPKGNLSVYSEKINKIQGIVNFFNSLVEDEFVPRNELNAWFLDNYEKAIKAVLDGYEVEESQKGFKLLNGKYLSYSPTERKFESGNVGIAFILTNEFAELSPQNIEDAKKYLKGEIVTEDEADD